ncbi:unnamed protein product, partial [Rotaria sordida]
GCGCLPMTTLIPTPTHWRGTPGANAPYYSGNMGGQQRSNGVMAPNSNMYPNQISGPRRS